MSNNCTIPTLVINDTDAVGDSAGKHNYNALVLDTNICNLSSQFFLDYNSVETVFQSITSYINNFTQIAPSFNSERVYKMSEAATTVKILSSYWNKSEFSVQYPINGAIINNGDIINAPALSAINQANVSSIIATRLKPLADIYINANFPATNFIDGTIINVNFFLYNVSPNPTNPNHLITFNSNPNTFSYLVRQMSVSFFRDNIYFTQGVNLRYYRINGIWNYIGYEAGRFRESIAIAGVNNRPKSSKKALEVLFQERTLKTTTFTSNSSIQLPADVTKVLVFLVGGGGGGGAGSIIGGTPFGGGGGGGGGIVFGVYPVSSNATYNITIGNGGNGGTSGNSGSEGATTIFSIISAVGGKGGNGSNILTPSLGGFSGPSGGSGGNGRTLTQYSSAGNDGFQYTDVLNFPNGEFFAGGGGGGGANQPVLAFGGRGGGGDGGNGIFPGSNGFTNRGGGGGGGGANGANGGNGGKGIAIIQYYTMF
jgi:hypothetical protein